MNNHYWTALLDAIQEGAQPSSEIKSFECYKSRVQDIQI